MRGVLVSYTGQKLAMIGIEPYYNSAERMRTYRTLARHLFFPVDQAIPLSTTPKGKRLVQLFTSPAYLYFLDTTLRNGGRAVT